MLKKNGHDFWTHQDDETAAFNAYWERKDFEEFHCRRGSDGVECEEADEQN